MGSDDVARLRVPPQSTEAENAVLGALLLDNSAWDRCADVLSAEDFYVHEHRSIYTTIGRLINANKPADAITVYEAGGHELSYLGQLSNSVPSASAVRHYALIVRERAMRRRLVAIGDELVTAAFRMGSDAEQSVESMVDEAVTKLMGFTEQVSDDAPRDIQSLLPLFVDHVTDAYEGRTDAIETGLVDLDEILGGGLRPGELTVVGARPSMGKTATTLTLVRNISRDHPTLMLSLEDSWKALVARLVASTGGVNLADLRRPQRAPDSMWQGLTDAVEELGRASIDLDDSAGLDYMKIRRKIQQSRRRFKRPHGLIVVDYLQLVEGEGDNRNQALGRIANMLKRAAKEFGSPIVLLSQLSRKADEKDGPPQMSHLRDSGDIEGAADNIALLYREFQRKPTPENKHHMEIHIVKQKNGPTGVVNVHFNGETQRIGNWSGPVPSKMVGRGGRSASKEISD